MLLNSISNVSKSKGKSYGFFCWSFSHLYFGFDVTDTCQNSPTPWLNLKPSLILYLVDKGVETYIYLVLKKHFQCTKILIIDFSAKLNTFIEIISSICIVKQRRILWIHLLIFYSFWFLCVWPLLKWSAHLMNFKAPSILYSWKIQKPAFWLQSTF